MTSPGKTESRVNPQITDAVDEAARQAAGGEPEPARRMAEQVMIHAVSLAMQNAVAEQQRRSLVRNALAAAAARAVLQSNPEDALHLFDQAVTNDDIVSTLAGLRKLMDELTGGESGKKA